MSNDDRLNRYLADQANAISLPLPTPPRWPDEALAGASDGVVP